MAVARLQAELVLLILQMGRKYAGSFLFFLDISCILTMLVSHHPVYDI